MRGGGRGRKKKCPPISAHISISNEGYRVAMTKRNGGGRERKKLNLIFIFIAQTTRGIGTQNCQRVNLI